MTDNIKFCPRCGKNTFELVKNYKDWFECSNCKLGYVIRLHSQELQNTGEVNHKSRPKFQWPLKDKDYGDESLK